MEKKSVQLQQKILTCAQTVVVINNTMGSIPWRESIDVISPSKRMTNKHIIEQTRGYTLTSLKL